MKSDEKTFARGIIELSKFKLRAFGEQKVELDEVTFNYKISYHLNNHNNYVKACLIIKYTNNYLLSN